MYCVEEIQFNTDGVIKSKIENNKLVELVISYV